MMTTDAVEPTVPRRWRLGTVCLGVLAASLLSLVSLRHVAATPQEMKARPGELAPAQAAVQNGEDATERLEFAGRVLDPDGKPLGGAKLHMVHFPGTASTPPVVRATTDAQGRFHFNFARWKFDNTSFNAARQIMRLETRGAPK
jgi:hypothetical protein